PRGARRGSSPRRSAQGSCPSPGRRTTSHPSRGGPRSGSDRRSALPWGCAGSQSARSDPARAAGGRPGRRLSRARGGRVGGRRRGLRRGGRLSGRRRLGAGCRRRLGGGGGARARLGGGGSPLALVGIGEQQLELVGAVLERGLHIAVHAGGQLVDVGDQLV